MAVLVNIIISAIHGIIGIELLTTIYYLAVILPGIAITVRRLRDAGINRPWIFIAFFLRSAGSFLLSSSESPLLKKTNLSLFDKVKKCDCLMAVTSFYFIISSKMNLGLNPILVPQSLPSLKSNTVGMLAMP